MIFATSCENELEVGAAGEESVVSFTISTPDMGSRAYSDGFTATQLQYAVYEGTTELADLTKSVATNNAETINGSTTVELKLATGKTYNVIFWAAAPNAPYTFTPADGKVSVDYDRAISNNENLDAFYAVKEITVKGAQTETIELRRPFAQLNIGTSDYDEAKSAGYEPTVSKVVVSNVYQSINLWDGKVSDNTEVTFEYNAIDKDETFPVSGYKYLAMNYLLVDARKELVEVTFSYKEASGEEKTRTVGSVPVQRNYRTNIYGQLLTSDVAVNVEIVPEYEQPDNEISTVVFSNVELQAALDAATTGTTTIYLGKDIEGDVVDFQKADRNIVIEGGNNKYNGTIKIHTGSNYNNGTITIKNVAFETSKASLNFIMPNEVGTGLRYPNNVTVEKCTFTATGAAENTAVGVQAKAVRNLQIIECTATGLHSLLQAQSCDTDNVIVKDCTINGKNGVAFKQVKNAVVEGTKINAAAYGIRFDGNTDNYGITARNINVTAVQPFIVRKMTGANNTIKLEGNNTLTASETYQIVITNGSDDEQYSTPSGTYTLIGADNFNVYPLDAPDYTKVVNADQLNAALADATIKVIELGAGEFGTIVAKSNKTIIGSAGAKVDCVNLNGADNLTLKNINFDAATAVLGRDGSGKAKQPANIVTGDNVNNPSKGAHNLVIDGCTFNGTFADGGVTIAFTDQSRGSGASGNVTIKNCTFNTVGAYCHVYGHYTGNRNNFVIENNVFKSQTVDKSIYLGRYASSIPVEVIGNKFETKAKIQDAVYLQAHSAAYSVSYNASGNTFAP